MDYSILTDVELVRILRAEGGLSALEADMLERIGAWIDIHRAQESYIEELDCRCEALTYDFDRALDKLKYYEP